MISVIDIIKDIVDAMKPTVSVVVGSGSGTHTVTGFTRTDLYFVGEKMKFIGTLPSITSYCTISAIDSNTRITITTSDAIAPSKGNSGTLQPVINFLYGHGTEIINDLNDMLKNATYAKQRFPVVCLFLDNKERIENDGFQSTVTLRRLVIATDTDRNYSSAQRKAANFDVILNPLYELFISRLYWSTGVQSDYPKHERWERYFWGKEGLYGNTASIFNENIDAIEINNLELKILKTC